MTSTAAFPPTRLPTDWSLANLQQHLGGIPLERIRLYPPPGMATEQDVLAVADHQDRLCELVDGIVVEKPVGAYESWLAGVVVHLLNRFLEKNDLGVVLGPDAPFRLVAGRLRLPDVSFISWDRLPQRKFPRQPVLDMAPDLAVEVLSQGNTQTEMQQKRNEYFTAGVHLVWYVAPDLRTVHVYTAPDQCVVLNEQDTLDGGSVLPGFQLPLRDLFQRVERAP